MTRKSSKDARLAEWEHLLMSRGCFNTKTHSGKNIIPLHWVITRPGHKTLKSWGLKKWNNFNYSLLFGATIFMHEWMEKEFLKIKCFLYLLQQLCDLSKLRKTKQFCYLGIIFNVVLIHFLFSAPLQTNKQTNNTEINTNKTYLFLKMQCECQVLNNCWNSLKLSC